MIGGNEGELPDIDAELERFNRFLAEEPETEKIDPERMDLLRALKLR